jgi:hypothetical protein
MNILKHVIDQKIHAKCKTINAKWTLKDKNLQQSHHLKYLKFKINILGKFQCTSLIIFSFDDALFFYFYFDTTLTFV